MINRREFFTKAGAAAAGIAGAVAGWRWLRGGWKTAVPEAATSQTALATPTEKFVHEAMHYKKLEEGRIECELCPRGCKVALKERGYCGVRENKGGTYNTLVYGRACSINVDPIEKKPLFHFLPGAQALSIATAGCNIECKFCQNWEISQFRPEQVQSFDFPPEAVVAQAAEKKIQAIAFTYTEPVVFYEYMSDTAKLAKEKGVRSVMISNGYIKEKPMSDLCKHLSAVKIDLKAFTEKFYAQTCSGHLQPVLDTLKLLKKENMWFELVVLIIPTLNDTPGEMTEMCTWVYSELGPDVPIHFSRFHPTYKIKNLPPTPVSTLTRARDIALSAGLNYAYVGNVPAHEGESTYCPNCKRAVVGRIGYTILNIDIKDGKCIHCGRKIAGIWS
jgi:pyruvate formate lyase activating enzyme